MRKKAVVTGASGHIGYHVAKELLSRGIHVTLLVRSENVSVRKLKTFGAEVYKVELLKPETWGHWLPGADCLFHLAAENTTDTRNEQRVIQNTLGLTRSVLETALATGIPIIIYTSSSVVLGRSENSEKLLNEDAVSSFQESPYVKGKVLAEQYCEQLIHDKQADIRRLYPSWVVGPEDARMTPPHKVIKDVVQKGQHFYFDGGISIASVEEVAKAHVNAWLVGRPNEKYVLGGNNLTFHDFFGAIARFSGQKPPSVSDCVKMLQNRRLENAGCNG